jgi:hypothetical protein
MFNLTCKLMPNRRSINPSAVPGKKEDANEARSKREHAGREEGTVNAHRDRTKSKAQKNKDDK